MLATRSRPPVLAINLVEHALRLHFEWLEPRRLLSSTLTIEGTSADDLIEIKEVANVIFVSVNGDVRPYFGSIVDRVVVNGLDGDDRIIASSDFSKPVNFDGGAGNDSLFGGGGNDELVGGDGTNYFDAGAGHDRIVSIGRFDAAHGGAGSDLIDTPDQPGNIYVGVGQYNWIARAVSGIESTNHDTNWDLPGIVSHSEPRFEVELVSNNETECLKYISFVPYISWNVCTGESGLDSTGKFVARTTLDKPGRGYGWMCAVGHHQGEIALPDAITADVEFETRIQEHHNQAYSWGGDDVGLVHNPEMDGLPDIIEVTGYETRLVRLAVRPEPQIETTFTRINFNRPELAKANNGRSLGRGIVAEAETDESAPIV